MGVLMSKQLWFAVAVTVSLATAMLGIWQLSRLEERRRSNALAVAGRSLPVLELDSTVDEPTDLNQRRVRVRGSYDHSQEIVLRGHLLQGAPGIHLVTPLRLSDSTDNAAILILRGFVPSADAASINQPIDRPTGEVTVEGIAISVPVGDDGGAPNVRQDGTTTWRRLDLNTLRERLTYPVLEYYILATGSGSGSWPQPVSPPPLDEGPHLSYAIQWLGISLAILGFGLVFILGIGLNSSRQSVPPPPL